MSPTRVWIAGVCALLLPGRVGAQDLTVARALEMLDSGLQAVKSYDVYVVCTSRLWLNSEMAGEGRAAKLVRTTKRQEPVTTEEYFRHVFQNGKGRVETLDGPAGEPVAVTVFDGEAQKYYDPEKKESIVRHVFDGMFFGTDYLTTFRNEKHRVSYLEYLRKRQRYNLQLKEATAERIVLESAPMVARDVHVPGGGLRLALAPRRGFLPATAEETEMVDGKVFMMSRMAVKEWKDLGNGVWVPVEVTFALFDWQKTGTFGEVTKDTIMKVDLARSSWNKPIPGETFSLPLPAGVTVTDFLRKVQYVTGKADPGANLRELAKSARKVMKFHVPSPPAEPKRAVWSLWAASALAVALLACGYWYFRRSKARVHLN